MTKDKPLNEKRNLLLMKKPFDEIDYNISIYREEDVKEAVEKLKEKVILSNKTHFHWSDFTKMIDKIFGKFE